MEWNGIEGRYIEECVWKSVMDSGQNYGNGFIFVQILNAMENEEGYYAMENEMEWYWK